MDQNFQDKWYEWQHIAGNVVPFVGGSSSFGFGYLYKATFNGSHPIVYFTEFPEDTTLVASGFDMFFNEFLNLVELSLINGNNIEIDIDDWPFNLEKLIQKDILLSEVANSINVKKVIDEIKRSGR